MLKMEKNVLEAPFSSTANDPNVTRATLADCSPCSPLWAVAHALLPVGNMPPPPAHGVLPHPVGRHWSLCTQSSPFRPWGRPSAPGWDLSVSSCPVPHLGRQPLEGRAGPHSQQQPALDPRRSGTEAVGSGWPGVGGVLVHCEPVTADPARIRNQLLWGAAARGGSEEGRLLQHGTWGGSEKTQGQRLSWGLHGEARS